MFTCYYKREAKREGSYDPEQWTEHPCSCPGCRNQTIVIAALLFPLALVCYPFIWAYENLTGE